MTGRAWACAPLLLACLLSACQGASGPTRPDASTPSTPAVLGAADPTLNARLPHELRERGVLRVRVDPTVPPLAMLRSDGDGLTGTQVALVEAVAVRWGLTVEWVRSPASALTVELYPQDADLAVGVLSTQDLVPGVDAVGTWAAGVRWAVPAGNPHHLTVPTMCGRTVAVHAGTGVRDEELASLERACKQQGNPVQVREMPGQDQVTAALVAGKVDAMVALGPEVDYALAHAPTRVQTLGPEGPRRPVALLVPSRDEDLADLLSSTLKTLATEGVVAEVAATWDVQGREATFSVVR